MSIFVNVNDKGNFYYNPTDANYTEEKKTLGPTYKTNTTCLAKLQRYELAPGITSEQASSCFTPFSFPAFLCLAF